MHCEVNQGEPSSTLTGSLLRTFEGHSSPVTSVAFSPDGSRVLSGDNTVKLWDATTSALVRAFAGQAGAVSSVAWKEVGQ